MLGFSRRIWTFLLERCPPLLTVLTAAMTAGVAIQVLFHMKLQSSPEATLPSAIPLKVAAIVIFYAVFLLFMRICDEFKDRESDLQNFPERPLPSGRVHESDLKVLLVIAVLTLCLLELTILRNQLGFVGLMVYGLLFARYFFLPQIMSRNLLLNLVTHNPLMWSLSLFLVATLGKDFGFTLMSPGVLALSVLLWMPSLAWETARKIRRPEDETAYQTYSRFLGYRFASLLPLIAVTLHFGILLWLNQTFKVSTTISILEGLAYFAVLFNFGKAAFWYPPKGSQLRTTVELYISFTQLLFILATLKI